LDQDARRASWLPRAKRTGSASLENINTEELVRDKAWEFLFTLGAARIRGGVQAIIHPIASK
jgi:hypothetical protein